MLMVRSRSQTEFELNVHAEALPYKWFHVHFNPCRYWLSHKPQPTLHRGGCVIYPVRLLRWTLVTRIRDPASVQPFLHVWHAS